MKIAVISNPIVDRLGPGDFLYRALCQICEAVKFNTGDETEGFDEYWYIDDGPSAYMAPKYHPARYFAIDFVVPPVWFVHSPDTYIERMGNFDHNYVFTSASQRYCIEHGIMANLIPFGADPDYHKPYDVEREYSWVAVWHNCGDRIAASDAAMASFPTGRVLYACYDKYPEYISRGICALNMSRADIVNMRVYEVMAVGTPLITNRIADLELFDFIEGQHYLGYDSVDEMVEKIGYIHTHMKEARKMANLARELVLSRHTYLDRVREILG